MVKMEILTWFLAFICLFALRVNADTVYDLKKVNPGDDMTFFPNVEAKRSVTKWSFEACEGCRMVLSCVILLSKCEDHVLTIDDGQTTKTYCGEGVDYALKHSHLNKLSFSIETAEKKTGSYCRLLVTKPYTNKLYEKKDSSEYGLGKNAKRKTSCRCGWRNPAKGRIVGGDETAVNEYPFVVLIMLKRRQYPYCGGSIISPSFVLTAAHCTFAFKSLRLAAVVGEHDTRTSDESPFTKIHDVEKTFEHPKYVDHKHDYDIAIMKLKTKIEFNNAVGPICLPSPNNKYPQSEQVTVAGWGYLKTNGTESPVLLKTDLNVIDLDICKTIFASVDKSSKSQICTWALGKDSCQGDSGGPLIWNDPTTNRYVQMAIVSFGRDCGSLDPAVNTDVSYYINWIKETIAEDEPEDICT